MLIFFLRHVDVIKLVAALTSIFSALYTFGVSTRIQKRNHEWLTQVVAWAADGRWLDGMQAGVSWVLWIMTLVYGPINEGASNWPKRFMTVRAWRMSAWIASLYLFVLFPGVLCIVFFVA